MTSFIDGLAGVRTVEDQLIAHDAATFPGTDSIRHTAIGAVFASGNRKLEVFNVNRTAVEHALGVDLLYLNEPFGAWTMIQYKCMEPAKDTPGASAVYRPDERFDAELTRMIEFRNAMEDKWTIADGKCMYRLSGDGFFFKLCARIQLEVLSEALLPGMYLAREHVQAILADPAAFGPRGGRQITFENTARHLSNTLFAELLRDGWIGTRGVSSAQVADLVGTSLSSGRAVVVARAKPVGEPANPMRTLAELNL
ncbi:hypothetical protein [Achromobacter denitrificans]|uniref:Restriction endonuclease n=1 Tax=Achromobacter denitrificans TaxID=32002 RepID=A0ABZ3GDT0_ACHDE